MAAAERTNGISDVYEPPALTELGGFAELTRGGIDGGADFVWLFNW